MRRVGVYIILALFYFVLNMQVQAKENPAQIIHEETGWDIQDIECVLQENWKSSNETPLPIAEKALLDCMKPYAAEFTGRSVKFECLAALAAFETGHFQDVAWNNVGGIINLDGEYERYSTIEDGITDLVQLLTESYLHEDGIWYGGGYTVLHIAKHYNTNIEWLVGYVDVRLSLQRRIDDANLSGIE